MFEFINQLQDNPSYLKKISIRFSKMLKDAPAIFEDFEEILNKPSVSESLITTDLLEEFIMSLQLDPKSGDTETKINVINKYNSTKGLNDKLINLYSTKIMEFAGNHNTATASFWLKQLETIIKIAGMRDNVFAVLNQTYTFLLQQYDSQCDQEWYKTTINSFLDVANKFYIASDGSKREIESWMDSFFARNSSLDISMEVNKLYQNTINKFKPFSR
jgi:hypothetical protein